MYIFVLGFRHLLLLFESWVDNPHLLGEFRGSSPPIVNLTFYFMFPNIPRPVIIIIVTKLSELVVDVLKTR